MGYRRRYRSYTKVRRKPQPAAPVVHPKGHWSKPIAISDPEYKDPGLRERYCVSYSQVRYRGVTELVAYRKDIKPTIWKDWTGHCKRWRMDGISMTKRLSKEITLSSQIVRTKRQASGIRIRLLS